MTILDITLITIASGLITAGFIGITNNPISRYLMKDFEKEVA